MQKIVGKSEENCGKYCAKIVKIIVEKIAFKSYGNFFTIFAQYFPQISSDFFLNFLHIF